MVFHDAWFFAVHQTFHSVSPFFALYRGLFRVPVLLCLQLDSLVLCTLPDFGLGYCAQIKPLFKRVHSQHHQIGSAITTLGTAFGDAADIGLCFVAFHLVLGFYLWTRPAWNAAAVVLLVIFEVSCSSTCRAAPVTACTLRFHAGPCAILHAPIWQAETGCRKMCS